MNGILVGLLLLSYWLMVSSAVRKSATVDEQSHLFRGAAYLFAGATHFQLGHPLLASTLSALPLLVEPALSLPVESEAWAEGDWSVAGDQFLWQRAGEPLRLLFAGRIVVIWLTLGLGALVLRWGRQLAGPAAGIAAAALVLLDPNVIAHGRLVTGDVPLALFFLATVYGYWRLNGALRRGRAWWPGLLITGASAGLAAATKFNAVLLAPVLLVQGAALSARFRDRRPLLALLPAGLLAWLVIAAVYRFELWRGFLPGGSFWDDLLWQGQYVGKEHAAFFFGQVLAERQWAYFPVAFLLKTPLPSLVFVAAAFPAVVRRREPLVRRAVLFLLVPAALYLIASMVAALNIGYRYLLPILPFAFLFAATALFAPGRRPAALALRRAALLLVLLTGARSLSVWPDYLSFFNAAVGDDGWRLLADSNVDWGQDLPALARWQQEEGGERQVYLSYFGTAHPSAYGLVFEPLPTWAPAPEQRNPARQPFNPADPAPGLYAISINNLHGFVLGEERDTFAWFRDREPAARVGGSLFVYDVPARGQPANLALSGLVPADLQPELLAGPDSNDLRIRWFDHTTGFVWPAGGGWAARAAGTEPAAELLPFWPAEPVRAAGGQRLFRITAETLPGWLRPAAGGDGPLRFRGAQRLPGAGGEAVFLTAWEVVERTSRPLKLYVHALDGDGGIAGQWDGLDVEPSAWWPGDVLVQSHRFAVPESPSPARFTTGVYDGATLERLAEYRLEEVEPK